MNLILDTCTINNLLQVDLSLEEDECSLEFDYLHRIQKEFDIKIPPKIYEELKNTFSKNLTTGYEIKFIKNYMSRYICNYVDKVDESDFESSLNFIKITHPKYEQEDNGELHLAAYALYLNRYKNTLAFQSYFVTDDDEAIDDFKDTFKINFLGDILTTIDLLLLMSVHGIISLSKVLSFALNLKRQYSQVYNKLINEIKSLQKKELLVQESALLTKIYNNIEDFNLEALEEDIKHKIFPNIKQKNKNIETFIREFLNEDFKKVIILEKKIDEIKSKFWDVSKI
ncbi:hypothetical protein [Arcobacter cloacae]|uniref:Uncharacterized protein n=1 Tax=Arcobacter cloacae TaxID=1054034 RepID=A0A6M8NKI4_9BACT|nr:hypothetical protein [Arcobacter cloacae]QKF89710.1 hypothetical protein ACLO_1209 [Arcobacter cloacae]RXI40707.1 hypothetical protein CP963_07985 [Arcobacter cloacae]